MIETDFPTGKIGLCGDLFVQFPPVFWQSRRIENESLPAMRVAFLDQHVDHRLGNAQIAVQMADIKMINLAAAHAGDGIRQIVENHEPYQFAIEPRAKNLQIGRAHV